MAQKVTVTLVDDRDGTTADETVSYSLDGVNYEIDLSTKNADKLRKALMEWVGYSRRSGGRRQLKPLGNAKQGTRDPEQSRAIRRWAKDNAIHCPERGRIPEEVVRKYEEAHAS